VHLARDGEQAEKAREDIKKLFANLKEECPWLK